MRFSSISHLFLGHGPGKASWTNLSLDRTRSRAIQDVLTWSQPHTKNLVKDRRVRLGWLPHRVLIWQEDEKYNTVLPVVETCGAQEAEGGT